MRESSIVKCPICGRENDFNADPFGPFCSSRCKMIDLGKWFNEEYKVSEPLRPDHLSKYEDIDDEALDDPNAE